MLPNKFSQHFPKIITKVLFGLGSEKLRVWESESVRRKCEKS